MSRAIDTVATALVWGVCLAGWCLFWYGLGALVWFIFSLK